MDRPVPKRGDWLDGIDVAAPCPASWAEMSGDDRCRFCSQCSLHVFDLSNMTRPEAEQLVASHIGNGNNERLCVRFTRRADGTVLTRDCPVGLRQRLRKTASKLVAMCTAAFAFLGCRAEPDRSNTPPERIDLEKLQGEIELLGDMKIPPERLLGRIKLPPSDPDRR